MITGWPPKQDHDAGYCRNEHDTNEINKDKYDPNDADCPLWNELPSLLRLY